MRRLHQKRYNAVCAHQDALLLAGRQREADIRGYILTGAMGPEMATQPSDPELPKFPPGR